MKLSAFDLNHARALHHLLEEAHVARAARRLGITPAAASNALHRLRVDFGDPLLFRSGRRLARTLRAEELRAPAKQVMLAAERLFEQSRPFDPATATWESSSRHRIALPSYCCQRWIVFCERVRRGRSCRSGP